MSKKHRVYVFFAVMVLFMIALVPTVILCERFLLELQPRVVDTYGKRGVATVIDNLELKIECFDEYELIKVWRKGSGEDGEGKKYDSNEVYVFLPSGADKEHVSFYYNDNSASVLLNGTNYSSGTYINGLKTDTVYKLVMQEKDVIEEAQLTFVQSKNLPVAFITTESESTHTLRQDKNNRESGTFKLIDSDGYVNYDGKLAWISGRGNSTWGLEKRPYIIKLQKEAELLKMPKAEKWVLFANYLDHADGLRNQIAYNLAIDTNMEYSSRLEFIDLYINEIYAGTYQLCEKIEVHKNRLDIGYLDESNEEINPGLDSLEGTYEDSVGLDIKTPNDYSGGYILERNYGSKLKDKPFFFITEGNEGFVVREPARVSNTEMDYIKGCMQKVENAILSDNGTDEETGLYYTELIDMDSWAKKFLMNVILKGENVGVTSSYFYKKQGDDLIYAGPAWDFDKTIGRSGGAADPNILMDNIGNTQWWACLYEKPEFYEMVVQYYKEIFRPCLIETIDSRIDEWAIYIEESNRINWIRWPEAAADCEFPEGMGTSEKESMKNSAAFLKQWLTLRISYLDSLWLNE